MWIMARTFVIVAAVLLANAGPTAKAASRCVMAGGSANMITHDLAVFMAKAALGNSIKGMGAKAAGPIKLKCDTGLPVYCLARQKACK
ncbi:MAG: hypothetical protein AB7L90_05910 [Hyphomicrobiaceae bacterium]